MKRRDFLKKVGPVAIVSVAVPTVAMANQTPKSLSELMEEDTKKAQQFLMDIPKKYRLTKYTYEVEDQKSTYFCFDGEERERAKRDLASLGLFGGMRVAIVGLNFCNFYNGNIRIEIMVKNEIT